MSQERSISHFEANKQAIIDDPEQATSDLLELAREANELEEQRNYLASLLEKFCKSQSDYQCPIFFVCPAVNLGWTCKQVTKKDWIDAAVEEMGSELR